MNPADLVSLYPQLHHMAGEGSWLRIQQGGLLTTRQLVDECDPDLVTRREILGQQRKRSYELPHPEIGTVTIRNQRPSALHNLTPALTDLTVEQWLDS